MKQHIMKYQIAIDKVAEVSPLLIGDSQEELKKKSDEFLKELQNSQYIKVPIVGVFSAGKSSLLNVFTQKPGMLPVDTEPETAVAYELFYSKNECVELYRCGKKIDSKSLTDIKQLETKPGDIAKVYCSSEPILKLQEQGIILVDMPGIGSGIERHDAAIFNYVNNGTAFVLVVDVEQGSLRGSTLAFMHELSQYNLCPAVLVSKIDKKPEEDVKDIVEYIQYQVSRLGSTNPFVGTVCSVNNNLDGFNEYLQSLNPETLISGKLEKKLKLIVNSVIEQLKVRIELRTKDIANVDEIIRKIDEEIAEVKVEMPSGSDGLESPEKSTKDVIDNVRSSLEAKATDIAQMIVDREDQESIKAVIVSTVRTEVVASLKEESEQYSSALGVAVQESIADLATIKVDADFMNNYSEILNVVNEYMEALLSLGGIWGALAEMLLPFLPDLMNWLFGKSDEEVLAEVREEVMNKCVNQVTKGIQPAILKIITENQKRIQEKIQTELVSKMEKVKEGLREKIADANKSKEEVKTELEELSSAITHLNSIIAEIQ